MGWVCFVSSLFVCGFTVSTSLEVTSSVEVVSSSLEVLSTGVEDYSGLAEIGFLIGVAAQFHIAILRTLLSLEISILALSCAVPA